MEKGRRNFPFKDENFLFTGETMSIKIVTDSTCDLPKSIIEQLGIMVIPLYINIEKRSYLDQIEITRQDFYQRLPEYKPIPTTAAPGSESFRKAYEDLAIQGATEILSIHISGNLSAVVDSATIAAQETKSVPVTVYDSGQLSLGLGFLVMKAAQEAAEGRSIEKIITSIEKLGKRTYVFAALNTLEFLRRSGRMNNILAGLGSLLQIKPILKMHRGEASAERVRTRERAINRIITLVEELSPLERIELVHTNAPEEAKALYQRAQHLFKDDQEPLIVDVTPVIGAHIGPGVVGFACAALGE
jgi:DegV family protein with EDD domain